MTLARRTLSTVRDLLTWVLLQLLLVLVGPLLRRTFAGLDPDDADVHQLLEDGAADRGRAAGILFVPDNIQFNLQQAMYADRRAAQRTSA